MNNRRGRSARNEPMHSKIIIRYIINSISDEHRRVCELRSRQNQLYVSLYWLFMYIPCSLASPHISVSRWALIVDTDSSAIHSSIHSFSAFIRSTMDPRLILLFLSFCYIYFFSIDHVDQVGFENEKFIYINWMRRTTQPVLLHIISSSSHHLASRRCATTYNVSLNWIASFKIEYLLFVSCVVIFSGADRGFRASLDESSWFVCRLESWSGWKNVKWQLSVRSFFLLLLNSNKVLSQSRRCQRWRENHDYCLVWSDHYIELSIEKISAD